MLNLESNNISFMDYFLKSVAGYLFQNHNPDFKDITLVFPNRRSGVFFINELKLLVNDTPIWSPKISTINELMNDFSALETADPIHLLAELYVEYKKMLGSSESFDDFYSWGELLLADFNDVDKYLVNAESVFVNVKNFKGIENQIDFLTEDQIKTLERFFSALDAEKSTKIKKEFLSIWEIMFPLYNEFKNKLIDKNIGFEGMVYQDALSKVKQLKKEDHSFKKIYFIGFNAITPAEEAVFEILKNLELAYFFWDFDDCYIENKEMEAGLFQRKYIKKFPPIKLQKNNNQLLRKKIKLLAAPTDYGQVFQTGRILDQIKMDNPADTAVILSDEQLLLPVLENIPDKIPDVNITMGYPLSDSLSGNFIDLLIQLQQHVRNSKTAGVSFYYKPVISLLRHPFIQLFAEFDANEIIERITKENLYYIPILELNSDELGRLLFVETKNTKEATGNIEILLQFIHEQLWILESPSQNLKLEREFLFTQLTELKKLHYQLIECNLNIELSTYYRLVKKVMLSIRVPFEGEPILGLQVMGFLETRNLDFKNVIILSVNEGIIPSPSRIASFIPYSLRRGFGLPTSELNDAMYAYYFYRILQGAENVWLLYNSGVGGMSTGEKSRLVHQLEYDVNFEVDVEIMEQSVDVISNKTIVIKKDGLVWDKMQSFFQAENEKYISPSALSIYLQCPLRFYFKSVAKVREADEIDEVVDARLFGNIFHKAAERIYEGFYRENILVTEDELVKLLKNETKIDVFLNNSFAEVFYGANTQRKFTIEGKNQIIFDVIKKYLIKMLKKDQGYAPFSIIGLEKNVAKRIDINIEDTACAVKIGGQIDRVDRSDKGLRIIDYKTGSDKLIFGELSEVFDPEKIKDTKAVFQTFLYSYLISDEFNSEKAILPMVYQVKQLFDDKNSFEISSKKHTAFQSGNFLDIKDEVGDYLRQVLEELFNKEQPFVQTENSTVCEYCPYKNMCGR